MKTARSFLTRLVSANGIVLPLGIAYLPICGGCDTRQKEIPTTNVAQFPFELFCTITWPDEWMDDTGGGFMATSMRAHRHEAVPPVTATAEECVVSGDRRLCVSYHVGHGEPPSKIAWISTRMDSQPYRHLDIWISSEVPIRIALGNDDDDYVLLKADSDEVVNPPYTCGPGDYRFTVRKLGG